METVLLQIKNIKAYSLLEDLEDLNIITVLEKKTLLNQKLSEKYKDVFTKEDAASFNTHTEKSRKEWDNF